jgi:hypothetical protein
MSIRLSPGVTLTHIEGKDVLFSVHTGDSYGLNETAARMLRLALEADLDQAASKLAEEYGASRDEIRGDLDDLVTELTALKLVQAASATSSGARSDHDA